MGLISDINIWVVPVYFLKKNVLLVGCRFQFEIDVFVENSKKSKFVKIAWVDKKLRQSEFTLDMC